MTSTETWARYGACRGSDPETFYTVDDFADGPQTRVSANVENRERALRAKLICSTCHVKTQCLQDALDSDDQYAVRGGLTASERNSLQTGKPINELGYQISYSYTAPRKRGWELVRRFAAGEKVADLCVEYRVKRCTALQEIRQALVQGGWERDVTAA